MRVPLLAGLVLVSPFVSLVACGGAEPAVPQPTAPQEVVLLPPPAPVASASAAPSSSASVEVATTPEPSSAPSSTPFASTQGAPPEFGTLGLTGTGGSGGYGEGIGLGSLGTIGGGRPTTPARPPPSIRMGATTVQGRLPPEVIQRIVRRNFGRFRLCYESGLRTNPTLAGKITVKFVIGKDGAVRTFGLEKSTMQDKNVPPCVVRAFGNLSFPQPESGEVSVLYPIEFAPPPPAPPAPPPSASASAKPAPPKPAPSAPRPNGTVSNDRN